ncbi:MAG: hypothetical protein WBM35_11265, partial [Candidatus Electrothrix sp.]
VKKHSFDRISKGYFSSLKYNKLSFQHSSKKDASHVEKNTYWLFHQQHIAGLHIFHSGGRDAETGS